MPVPESRPLRSDTRQTREALLAAAERLFAERGIDDVSLGEITRAAGQKNRSALTYHFGSREALLQAVLDRHAPAITAEREMRLAAITRQPGYQLRDVVEALVMPLAARLDDSSGGVAYLRITAQMLGSEQLHLFRLRPDSLRRQDPLMRALQPLIPPLPPAQQRLRMQLVGSFLFHALADQAAMHRAMALSQRQAFVNQLVDSIVAMLLVVPAPTGEHHD